MPVAERKVYPSGKKARIVESLTPKHDGRHKPTGQWPYNVKASRRIISTIRRKGESYTVETSRRGPSVPRTALVVGKDGALKQVGQLAIARAKRVARTRARDKMNRRINGRGRG